MRTRRTQTVLKQSQTIVNAHLNERQINIRNDIQFIRKMKGTFDRDRKAGLFLANAPIEEIRRASKKQKISATPSLTTPSLTSTSSKRKNGPTSYIVSHAVDVNQYDVPDNVRKKVMSMKVRELSAELRNKGAPVSGRKEVLARRLLGILSDEFQESKKREAATTTKKHEENTPYCAMDVIMEETHIADETVVDEGVDAPVNIQVSNVSKEDSGKAGGVKGSVVRSPIRNVQSKVQSAIQSLVAKSPMFKVRSSSKLSVPKETMEDPIDTIEAENSTTEKRGPWHSVHQPKTKDEPSTGAGREAMHSLGADVSASTQKPRKVSDTDNKKNEHELVVTLEISSAPDNDDDMCVDQEDPLPAAEKIDATMKLPPPAMIQMKEIAISSEPQRDEDGIQIDRVSEERDEIITSGEELTNSSQGGLTKDSTNSSTSQQQFKVGKDASKDRTKLAPKETIDEAEDNTTTVAKPPSGKVALTLQPSSGTMRSNPTTTPQLKVGGHIGSQTAKLAEMREKSKPVASNKPLVLPAIVSSTLKNGATQGTSSSDDKDENTTRNQQLAAKMRQKAGQKKLAQEYMAAISQQQQQQQQQHAPSQPNLKSPLKESSRPKQTPVLPENEVLKRTAEPSISSAKEEGLHMDTYKEAYDDQYGCDDEDDEDFDSDDDDDDDYSPNEPSWTMKHNILRGLQKQMKMEADDIFGFGEVETCNLEEIFGVRMPHYKRRYGSGIWRGDRVTSLEKLEYRRAIMERYNNDENKNHNTLNH